MQLFQFIAGINLHTYLHTLFHLDEIARRIVNRNQRERTSCSIRNTHNLTSIFNTRNASAVNRTLFAIGGVIPYIIMYARLRVERLYQ